MKRLTLLRHAKSSWTDPSRADRDRPLNKRGKQDAPRMGRRLAARGIDPDLIITSPAKRACRTARAVAEQLEYPWAEVQEEEDIYEADVATLLHIIRTLDDDAQHVLMVGHNPGFTDVGNLLSDAGIGNLPTCGALCIDFSQDTWATVGPGSGQLAFLDYPKNPAAGELP